MMTHMDLSQYLNRFRQQLLVAARADGEQASELAEGLAAQSMLGWSAPLSPRYRARASHDATRSADVLPAGSDKG